MEHFRPHERALGAEKLPAGFSRLAQVSRLINQIDRIKYDQSLIISKVVSLDAIRLNYQLPQLISFILLTGSSRITWENIAELNHI